MKRSKCFVDVALIQFLESSEWKLNLHYFLLYSKCKIEKMFNDTQ